MEKPQKDRDIDSSTDNSVTIDGAAYKNVKNTYEKYADAGHLVEKKKKAEKITDDDEDLFGIKSTEVKSLKDFKENTQKAIENVKNSIDIETIEKLLNISDSQKLKAFALEVGIKVGKMTKEQELAFIKKIDEWQVPKEISEANAAVVLTWLREIK